MRASREAAPDDRHPVALPRGAADRRVDRPRARGEPAAGQRQVDALDLAAPDLRLQRRVGLVVAGDDEQAAGVLVEPVDDPGPLGVGAAAEELPSSSTRVGPRCEGAGWTTRPAGLSTTARSLVEVDDAQLVAAHLLCLAQVDQGEARRRRAVIATSARLNGGQRADVDVVGDRAGAEPVGEVAERAAGEQADRDPHPGPGRVAGEEEADEGERDERRRRSARAPPPLARPKATPLVVGEGEAERAEHVDVLARGRGCASTTALAAWSSDDDQAAERAGQAPGAAPLRGAHPAIRPTTTARRRRGR